MGHQHPTPEQDMQLAQQALAQGDLGHALHHVGGVLSTDPTQPQALAMLDAILRRADDPLRLTELSEEPSFIDVANRAQALAIKHHWLEAFSFIAQVVATRPDIPYLAWAVTWAQYQGVAASLDAHDIFPQVLAHLIRGLPNPCPPNDPARKNVEHARVLAAVLREVHPRQGAILYFGSAIARRLSLHDEAIQLGKQALQVDPSYLTAIGYACALRDANRTDEAIAAFKEALRFDPNDIAVWLDVGDLHVKSQQWVQAAEAYQKALEKEPQHEWALPSWYFARAKAGDPESRAKLQELRDRQNRRAWELCEELTSDFIDTIPAPRDSTYRALVTALRQSATPTHLASTALESPSVMTAYRLTGAAPIQIAVSGVQTPDPRVPKGQVDFVLWAYDGTNARPNVPPPDPRVLPAVSELAASPYNLDQWHARAAPIAQQMGPAWITQLGCAMVHACPPPPNMDPFEWVQRMQIASALVIGHIDRRALQTIALGPVDWTTNAAILALSRHAKTDPNARRDVEQLFGYLRQQLSPNSFTCYEHALVVAWLDLGSHAPNVEHDLRAWRDRLK